MKKKILIVEDDALNMKLYEDLLQATGYETIQDISGANVLQLVEANRPDLILMDIQLPEISGLELAKILKADEKYKEIPIIAVTAFAMRGDEQKIRGRGCDGYIAKPISVSYFLGKLEEFLS